MKTLIITFFLLILMFWAYQRVDRYRLISFLEEQSATSFYPEQERENYYDSAQIAKQRVEPILDFSFSLLIETILIITSITFVIGVVIFFDPKNLIKRKK